MCGRSPFISHDGNVRENVPVSWDGILPSRLQRYATIILAAAQAPAIPR